MRIPLSMMWCLLLVGCGTFASEPTVIKPLSSAELHSLQLAAITVEIAPGVKMSEGDAAHVRFNIEAAIRAKRPGVFVAGSSGWIMKLRFTKFGYGNAASHDASDYREVARMQALVSIVDPAGEVRAQYEVYSEEGLGGLTGGLSPSDDTEEGFVRTVANIVDK